MTQKNKYNVPLEAINNVYNGFPAFSDIFDEETFYIFAFCFTLGTILLAFILSRFITIKERHL